MGPANCAVVGCYNSIAKLKKWQDSLCTTTEPTHEGMLHKNCSCKPPFVLFMFPSEKRNGEKKKEWISLLKRQTEKKTAWIPCGSDRVCSQHFIDGMPTVSNPNPTLNLGYNNLQSKPKRRVLFRSKPKNSDSTSSTINTASSVLLSPPRSPSQSSPPSETLIRTLIHQTHHHSLMTPPDHDYVTPLLTKREQCKTCEIK